MPLIAILTLALSLPALPAAFAVPCGADQFTGVATTGRPSIVLSSSDLSASGSALFRFRVAGYVPPAKIGQNGPILAVGLDSQPPLFTTLRASDPYGTFDLAFTELDA